MKPIILNALIAAITFSGAVSFAEPTYEQMQTFHDVQRLRHVEGQERKALELARDLQKRIESESTVYKDLSETIHELERKVGDPDFDLQKAIKFITGEKVEIYCRDVGLVEIRGKHNDGAVSRVLLVKNNRRLTRGSYSQMRSGDWIYELSNTYRPPMNSELWMTSAGPNNFRVSEIRELKGWQFDRGTWIANWNGSKRSHSFTTSGTALEPLPVYMALDFHLWGQADLGFPIKFRRGFTEVLSSDKKNVGPKKIILKSRRTVGVPLAIHSFVDSKGMSHQFKDCYPVDYAIELDHLEDSKSRSENP